MGTWDRKQYCNKKNRISNISYRKYIHHDAWWFEIYLYTPPPIPHFSMYPPPPTWNPGSTPALRPDDLYMLPWTLLSLVQVMACYLFQFGAKTILEPILTYCQLDSRKQTCGKLKYENLVQNLKSRETFILFVLNFFPAIQLLKLVHLVTKVGYIFWNTSGFDNLLSAHNSHPTSHQDCELWGG